MRIQNLLHARHAGNKNSKQLAGLDVGRATLKDIGLLENYYFYLRARNLSRKTIQDYTERLQYLVDFAKQQNKGLLDLTENEIQHLLVDMVDRLAPITVNGRCKDWNLFYEFIRKQGLAGNGWQNPVANIPRMKEPRKTHRLLTPEEYSKMIRGYKPSFFQGLRNQCILLVAWDTMIRREELIQIRTKDVELRPRKLLRIFGKGRKERMLTFSDKTALKLSQYIHQYRADMRGDVFFCTKHSTALDIRHASRIFANAAAKVGLPMRVGPHLVRRSSATCYWRKTGNIYLVSQILGHANVRITEEYVEAHADDLVAAYELMTPADDLKL